MSISLAEAQRRGWLPKQQPTTPTTKRTPPLIARLSPICEHYGWLCDECRMFCTDERSVALAGTQTIGRANCVVVWRTGRVERLGWIWDVQVWSEEQVEMRLKEMER